VLPPTPPPPVDGGVPVAGDGDGTPPSGSRTGLIIGIIVAALAVIGVAGFFLTRDDDDDTVTADTTPELTVPEVTSPELTVPGESVPDPTLPDVTTPDVTTPDFSIPDFSIPDLSIPDLSIPDITVPDVVAGPIPPAVDPPDGLGDDAAFNDLANDCYDGSMQACDDLYDGTVAETALNAYTLYGDTCAGRQPEGTQVYCTVTFPGE
jgi:hypothetical protein